MWSAFSVIQCFKKIITGLSHRLVLFALSSICPDTEKPLTVQQMAHLQPTATVSHKVLVLSLLIREK